jgi:hypothetical protein
MRTLFIFLLFIWGPIIAHSQIQTTIGDFETDLDFYLTTESRFFVGSFNFQSLPRPLEPCKVDFILEISKEQPEISANEWEIKIDYRDDAVRIISDTVFHWPGPHKVGSRFTGTLEFIPLRSGYSDFGNWSITLYYHHPVWNLHESKKIGIGFRWCLSPDGELLYLGKGPGMPEDCGNLSSIFFKGDSIHIASLPGKRSRYPFLYSILIEPQPRIGDTSIVHYFLKSQKDFPAGFDLRIEFDGMEIKEPPTKMDNAISNGDELELRLKIVPLPIRFDHSINLMIRFEDVREGKISSQSIKCFFVFNEDSTLKLINTEGFPPFREDLYPTNFPDRIEGDGGEIDIKRNDNDSL